MQSSTLLILRRLSVLAILFLFSTAMLTAQIKIKSRVEIKPTNIKQLNKAASSTIQPGTLLIDSDVQGYLWGACIYYFEVNGIYFGSTTPVARFSQLLPCGPMNEFGRFPARTLITPRVSFFTETTSGYPDPDLIQEPCATETLTFLMNPETGGYEPGGYVSMSIGCLFNHFDGTFSKGQIEAGETAILNLAPIGNDGGSVGLIDDVPIYIFADTMIQFVDPDGVGGSNYLGGSKMYTYRWGKAKNGIQVIGNEIYGDGGYYEEDVGFGLNRPVTSTSILVHTVQLCPKLKLSKNKINPGDTVAINIICIKPDGTPVSNPPDQYFILQMDADWQYGRLHCISNNEEGLYLYGQQPFEFIAADSINVDSIVVNIIASSEGSGGGGLPCSVNGGQGKDTLQRHAVLMSEKQTNSLGKNAVLKIDGTTNVLISPQASITKKLTEQNTMLAQKAAKKQALMNAITEAIKTQNAGKGDAASAKQLNAMILDLAEGSSCCDTAKVTIKKPKLTIVEHSPWTLWPYLPPQNNTPHNRGADRPGYNPKRTFTIQLLKGDGTPYPNQQISIFTKYKEGSGGHRHTGWADTGGHIHAVKALPQDTLQGKFYYKGGKVGQNPLTVTTETDGTAKIDSFIASQASGNFLVTARMARDTTIMDTVNLQVKVDGLVQFGIGSYWGLTGTTSKMGINHKSNHWCTQKMKDSLTAAIKDFYNWSGTEIGGDQYIKLGIDDMCLEWGGAFDFPGLWNFNNDHSFHRVGLSVDIDNTQDGDLRYKNGTLTRKGKKLREYMEKYGGQKYNLEKPIHFGFDNQN